MKKDITASMLYDWIHCPHRVTMDLFGDHEKKDPVSEFVKLLWEKGKKGRRGMSIPVSDVPAAELSLAFVPQLFFEEKQLSWHFFLSRCFSAN